ncbi:conserved protein of unknown function [Rhodovastum atsumiense]|uniref:Uncharacterized protein n=1 Tax=Rhodovastum atsumiense TaxID=504468 RepID=A0A5M6IZZ8_9PROT|nr:hypothetical protein [Rhodovastum atsumiense]KAA5612918.1 hypothetical protein F1189_07735 [Rhodovastum atsumiense]CAH2600998.1 conserved protein of unknown function [Rhodovastum atsumiense]
MPFDAVGVPAGAGPCPVVPPFLPPVLQAIRDRIARMRRNASNRPEPLATLTILRAARSLIADERDWAQGTYVIGHRRCVIAALEAVGARFGRRSRLDAATALATLARAQGFESIERMNDAVTHADLLASFDAAIARASAALAAEAGLPARSRAGLHAGV